jgi:membrane protein
MRAFFRRLVGELIKDNVLDVGAMMAYYAVLALFPMLFVVVTITLLVLPTSVLDQGVAMATEAVPHAARDVLVAQIHHVADRANAGFAIVGSAIALWGASRGATSLITALNAMYHRKETRSWIHRQLLAIAVTLGVAGLLVIALALLVAGPWLGHLVTEYVGGGDVVDAIWSIGRWVLAGLLVMTVWAIVYHFLPNRDAKLRLFTPGAIVGVALWVAISWGFGVYLSHFSSYETTYGTLGTAVIFLTWLWLSNVALLVGAEINDVLAIMRRPATAPVAESSSPVAAHAA